MEIVGVDIAPVFNNEGSLVYFIAIFEEIDLTSAVSLAFVDSSFRSFVLFDSTLDSKEVNFDGKNFILFLLSSSVCW